MTMRAYMCYTWGYMHGYLGMCVNMWAYVQRCRHTCDHDDLHRTIVICMTIWACVRTCGHMFNGVDTHVTTMTYTGQSLYAWLFGHVCEYVGICATMYVSTRVTLYTYIRWSLLYAWLFGHVCEPVGTCATM